MTLDIGLQIILYCLLQNDMKINTVTLGEKLETYVSQYRMHVQAIKLFNAVYYYVVAISC